MLEEVLHCHVRYPYSSLNLRDCKVRMKVSNGSEAHVGEDSTSPKNRSWSSTYIKHKGIEDLLWQLGKNKIVVSSNILSCDITEMFPPPKTASVN